MLKLFKKKQKQNTDNEEITPDSSEPDVVTNINIENPNDKPIEEKQESEKKGWFQQLKGALSGSSRQLASNITGIFTQKKLDNDLLDELNDALIMSDIGVDYANTLIEALRKEKFDKDVTEKEVRQFFAAHIAEKLAAYALPIPETEDSPTVIMMVGVNGTGKTTTIGKLAAQWKSEGKKVMVAAADTFRAAAVEQLEVWTERAGCEIIKGAHEADPASVAYQAIKKAKAAGADILLIDTAGRLQNKSQLMDELKKIRRVLQKFDETIPHSTLLVLDATVGQNAHSQVKTFQEMADITGLIITKLDGSAKAGVLMALADKYELPIHAIGVGEGIEDLRPFTAQDYANALMGLNA